MKGEGKVFGKEGRKGKKMGGSYYKGNRKGEIEAVGMAGAGKGKKKRRGQEGTLQTITPL
jgi:hypothetical protein